MLRYQGGKGESVLRLRLRACPKEKIPFPISSKGRTVSLGGIALADKLAV